MDCMNLKKPERTEIGRESGRKVQNERKENPRSFCYNIGEMKENQ